MAPASFFRLFARCFGVPPARYVLQRRAAAQRLLRETERTLEDIGRSLGFADAFHFSKAFKRVTGVSPREFRKQRREEQP